MDRSWSQALRAARLLPHGRHGEETVQVLALAIWRAATHLECAPAEVTLDAPLWWLGGERWQELAAALLPVEALDLANLAGQSWEGLLAHLAVRRARQVLTAHTLHAVSEAFDPGAEQLPVVEAYPLLDRRPRAADAAPLLTVLLATQARERGCSPQATCRNPILDQLPGTVVPVG